MMSTGGGPPIRKTEFLSGEDISQDPSKHFSRACKRTRAYILPCVFFQGFVIEASGRSKEAQW